MIKQSAQEVFDTCVGGILSQGKLSYQKDKYDLPVCLYRNIENGHTYKCAVGHIIPDSDYDPKFENALNVRNLLGFQLSENLKTTIISNIELLASLQLAHDNAAYLCVNDQLDEFKTQAKRVASHHALKWNFA